MKIMNYRLHQHLKMVWKGGTRKTVRMKNKDFSKTERNYLKKLMKTFISM